MSKDHWGNMLGLKLETPLQCYFLSKNKFQWSTYCVSLIFFKSYQLHIQASTNRSINLVYERGQIYYRNKPISARFHELVDFVTFDRILQWSFHICSNSYDNKPYSIQISRTVDTPRNAIGYRRIYTQISTSV